ncbi:hypothetical protein BLA60_04705 [Actinophytocola xinjiangensis]|uniref:Acyl transferase domain-containing protein n=2 Tax=Actinophytocola xinjiangensis TaxID=485602 RepID=A0A7Z1B0A6_9PSEU|nr:hypothetical protein BLA60_04705 [Actinophytocola xinjiangensis]
MAGRFPEARDLDDFWRNLADGRDCLTEPSDDELLRYGERPEYLAHPGYVRGRHRMPDGDLFDPACFGMTPREAELRDPQQRLLLELAGSALDHAGYDPARYPGAVGVFGGAGPARYRANHVEPTEVIQRNVGLLAVDVSNDPDYVATFISHRLGLTGPSMTVQTACSTSLIAVHLACQSLRLGECDMALAGGANIEMPLDCGYIALGGGIRSADGRVRPFDERAGGTNFGTGGGVVVLKRLADALRDGDTVHAVVRGSAVNNDGDRKAGFSAPSEQGQAECVRAAIESAGVDARAISYVEAHGTGTKVGDPVEVAGLATAFAGAADEALPPGSCVLGSVKGNVGHLGVAAGICGFIKTVLALTHEEIPATVNHRTPNPKLSLADTPFAVAVERVPWPRTKGAPRVAGVSSFGIGGSNGHVILEEAPEREHGDDAAAERAQVVVWSAATESARDTLTGRLAEHLADQDAREFRDAAHTLRAGRAERRHRAAVVATGGAEAARLMRGGTVVLPDTVDREVVFCFPGQGSQHNGMLRELYRTNGAFREECDTLFDLTAVMSERDLRALWLSDDTDQDTLKETSVAQPLLFVLELALGRCLVAWGLRPARMVGHSVGELVAATLAGVFGVEDGLRAVIGRSGLMAGMPRGRMVAVSADVDAVRELLGADLGGVALAAVNSDRQIVLSGSEEDVVGVADRLRAAGTTVSPLHTSHGFHSPSMAVAAEKFADLLATVDLGEPRIPVVSAATGRELTAEQARTPSFWARQLVDPVLFAPAVAAVVGAGPAFLVEVGPGQALTDLLRGNQDVRASRSVALATQPRPKAPADRRAVLENTLARLWVEGQPVDLREVAADARARRVPAPGYPYERRRCWIERPPGHVELREGDLPVSTPQRPEAAPVPTAETDTDGSTDGSTDGIWSVGTLEWRRSRTGRPPLVDGEVDGRPALLALPADPGFRDLVRDAFLRAGFRTIRATGVLGTEPAGRRTLDVTSDQDWDAFLDRLGEAAEPVVVAYAVGLSGPEDTTSANVDEALRWGFHGLLRCARAVVRAQRRLRVPLRLVVITRRSVDITGAEPVNPANAMALGFLRSLEKEHPEIQGMLIDLSADTAVEVLSGELAEPSAPTLALRGTSVWVPALAELARSAPAGRHRVRQRGVYLVTGGLGGIGLVVARELAESGRRPRIALVGRSGPPDETTPAGARVADALESLSDAGAEVGVFRADVADAASLRSAVAEIEARFGTVNGVVHAAGVAGGGLLAHREHADIEAVLAPKVRGTLNLHELLGGRSDLDFLLLFSSQAGLGGLLGSADYAAANAFLDAFAQRHGRGGRHTVAIGWPGWSEVGMLAESEVNAATLVGDQTDGAAPGVAPGVVPDAAGARLPVEYRRTFTEQDWELDEHRFEGQAVLVGTAAIELVVTAVRSLGLYEADLALTLRDVVFASPILGAEQVETRVVFHPREGEHRFTVETRQADGTWRGHVEGVVAAGPTDARPADPVSLRSGYTGEGKPDIVDLIEFGPRWDCIAAMRWGTHEAVLDLELPEKFHDDLDLHPLHPALFDRASVIPPADGVHRLWLPFMYERLTVFAPLPARILVHAWIEDFDQGWASINIDIHDPDTGAQLVRVESYTFREVRPAEFVQGLRATPDPGPRPAPAGDQDVPLLSPQDGASVFAEVLNGSYPPFVAVNPAGGRWTVAGVPWVTDGHGPPEPVGLAQPPVPRPAERRTPSPTAGPAPEVGEIASMVRTFWIEALGLDGIGYEEDFFELGGNSLVAVQLIARVGAHYGLRLSPDILFEASTVTALAGEVGSRLAEGEPVGRA